MEEILHLTEQSEKEYDWSGAAGSYEKAMNLLPRDDFSKTGEIHERLGYALYRLAFQAETFEEFIDRLRQSTVAYGKAIEFYGRSTESEKTARTLRCNAAIAYIGYWLASEAPEKKRLLDECWRLTKEALKSFEEAGESLEYGKTYNQLSSSAFDRYVFEWSFQAREKLMKEALEHGERTVTLLSGVSDPHELARVYVKTAMYLTIVGWYFVSDLDEKEGYYKKGFGYWQKANELSEETAFLELLSICESFDWSHDESIAHYDKALDYAKKTKDKYMIGSALDWLAYNTQWKAAGTDDPDKRLEFYQKALQYAKDTMNQFSSISYISPRGGVLWTGAPNMEYYYWLGFWETDLRKKRDFLEKAAMEGSNAIKQAENTGYPDIVSYVHYIFAGVLGRLAQLETNSEEKRKLLEKALEHSTESLKLADQLERFVYWNLGVRWSLLADSEAELSDLERNAENRKRMLEEAVSHKERGLQLCIKHVLYLEKTGVLEHYATLGFRQYTFGEWLSRLSVLANNNEHQRRAIKAFEEAAQSYQKLSMFSRVAECRWKAAGSFDALGEHLKAAENFNSASDNYKDAAEKIPQLKNLYQDYASYMEAWNTIEKARHHHAEKQYGQAKEHYEKAANLHKSTTRWNYLSPNYLAWARLEEGEDLSRKEQTEEAKDLFQKAAKLFAEAKKSIQAKLEEIESKDEEELLVNLAEASDIREEYCLGRIALEEAKILDKQGDHAASSKKYGSATEKFQKATDAMKDESDRQELKPIVYLCQAWQTMTRAEAEASPDLYKEASKLFEEAKDRSVDEKAKMLALGHSRFCKALEAGTRYEDSRDTSLHTLATQHLESAASYYLKAGFKSASEYAEATQKLLDAYLYMHKAKTANNPTEKAQFYMMAEKVLQASAGSYLKAKHPEKQEQVSSLLEKVKNERELALSLTEVLHAPLATSTTATFTTPTPTQETPTGLERFEQADIQANLIVRQKELKIGEPLNLEIELVNAGKGPALLIKVNEVIPEGFKLDEKPESYKVEDSYIDMKGKRLGPLKTEELRLVLKPKVQGSFVLKPTVLYLDENGKYKSHEPESVTIIVKELGIKGWIKGER